MSNKLSGYLSVIVGFAVLLIVLDLIVLLFRAIGMDKATAIYLAIVLFGIIGYVISSRYFKR